MSALPGFAVFTVVLAVNLLLIGAVLAGGVALIFRFTENIPPRIRYYAVTAVFLAAASFPFVAALRQKDNAIQRKEIPHIVRETARRHDSVNLAPQNYLSGRRNINFDSTIADEKPPDNFLNDFITRFGDSFYGNVFLSIWILGSILLFTREIVGLARLKRARKFWIAANERERGVLQCPETVRLYFAENQTPGTVGLFRPALVLPKEFPSDLSFESKRFIVQHELAHARGFDPLGNFIVRAIRNLLWISPALWLLGRLIDAEREAAADRAAIGFSQTGRASETLASNYAETLLLIAKAFSVDNQKNRQLPLIGIGSGSELEIRVRRLLSSRRANRLQTALALGACLLTAVLIAVIPLAAFSEISKTNRSSFAVTENNRGIFLTEENTDEALRQNEDIILPQAEISPKNDRLYQSYSRLKKAADEDSAASDPISTYDAEQTGRRNLKFAGKDENAEVSAKTLSEQDARETASGENQQQVAARLNNLAPLPAVKTPDDQSKTPQKMQPASALKTVSPDEGELTRQKTASEFDRRRNYSADYPEAATAPQREIYETRYIPYPAKRNER